MKRLTFKFLVYLLASGGIFQAGAGEPPPSAFRDIRLTPWVLDVSAPAAAKRPGAKGPRLKAPRLAGTALVEVWGDSPWALNEHMRLFRMELVPGLMQAFALGAASTTNSQQLGEFMTMTAADVRPPSVPAVYYNGFRKVDDPELVRDGIHIGVKGKATLTIGASAARR